MVETELSRRYGSAARPEGRERSVNAEALRGIADPFVVEPAKELLEPRFEVMMTTVFESYSAALTIGQSPVVEELKQHIRDSGWAFSTSSSRSTE